MTNNVVLIKAESHVPYGELVGNIECMKFQQRCLPDRGRYNRVNTNKLEDWYVRYNNVCCSHLWATCFNLYTGHFQALLYI